MSGTGTFGETSDLSANVAPDNVKKKNNKK